MESQKAKVAMYVKRSFGDKMNASFDFIKENWKPLFKFATYLILPLCLIQALSLNGLMNGSMGITMGVKAGAANPLADFGTMFWVNYGLTIICYLIGSVILTSLVYALIKTYNEREERLEGVTLSSLKSLLLKNVGRLTLPIGNGERVINDRIGRCSHPIVLSKIIEIINVFFHRNTVHHFGSMSVLISQADNGEYGRKIHSESL